MMLIFLKKIKTIFLSTTAIIASRYAMITFTNPIAPGGDLLGIVCSLLDWVFYLSIPIGLVAIMYSAFLFLTSGGERNKISSARMALIAAIMGWVALFIVSLLPRIIADLLGVDLGALPASC
ncbi:MAG: hypothetical protein A2806_01745 [Candidatus Terrybacteria bacterium RIFCSPHIGHO2_01_FULL_48_17]|uniref:Uncharacterized protein n=1 Tax=Candidatus Terrybacteria bacterium RIFCSPHIGHO2_01_FULL_48_17 TaxID=1802362 RepID=A0A1G2PL54_9BACT|nr:MAG: hypothetical protein A2806_01745 [Candidatus Terrybacteria bacterium RIFCSPHIGHO2_01_FULL_48_17]OHA52668.1 MAG: hypothetical protein A3A30_03550 [Candidatus Terrybacteria bacterium RIFCSPLOWO2_01_FULL_48_14]